MKGLYKYLILLIQILCTGGVANAAPPTWFVDPSLFEYSMTVTAILNIDGEISMDGNDKVAAFINGACRGVASPSAFTTEDGKKLVFLKVYSNTIQGENVIFKMYDASADIESMAINELTFLDNGITGTTSDPFIITTNQDPTDLTLSSIEVMEGQNPGAVVGSFIVTDPDGGATSNYTYTLVSGAFDNASFAISGNQLTTSVVFDHDVKTSYSVLVEVSDGKGGTFQKEITVFVTIDPDKFSSGNYISPNGDGKNDVWKIKNSDVYKDYKVTIFNDAGVTVYSTTDYQNQWDGTLDGKKLPTGVYYFLVQSPDQKRKFTGSITLNR